jgi:hypothetical protein
MLPDVGCHWMYRISYNRSDSIFRSDKRGAEREVGQPENPYKIFSEIGGVTVKRVIATFLILFSVLCNRSYALQAEMDMPDDFVVLIGSLGAVMLNYDDSVDVSYVKVKGIGYVFITATGCESVAVAEFIDPGTRIGLTMAYGKDVEGLYRVQTYTKD